LLAAPQSLSASVQPVPSTSVVTSQSAGFVELQSSTVTDPAASQYSYYQQSSAYQQYPGLLQWIFLGFLSSLK